MPAPRSHALVLVTDGRKALFLTLTGSLLPPQLKLLKVIQTEENPPTRDQGTDRPGRAFQSVGKIRSALEQTDWHELEEKRFIGQVISVLQDIHKADPLDKLTLIAPPRALSYVRQQLSPALKKLVNAEFAKDLVGLPVTEIERHLASA